MPSWTDSPWGRGMPWYEVMNDITKVTREYRIKMPKNWQDGDWSSIFRDWGFLPVDPKAELWYPVGIDNVMGYAALLEGVSSTVEGTAIGTTTTALIDTASPIIDLTYTEIGSETVATVTTQGAVTATSSAVATGAVGAAIGFGVGVGIFETAPEFCTKVSNAVFGTDLDPEEIGEMARDTNALVVIKDGIVYMAEDMINAIRNAFFDNGAAESTVSYPTIDSTATKINVITSLSLQDFLPEIDAYLGTTVCASSALQSKYDDLRSLTDEGYAEILFSTVHDKPYVLINYNYDSDAFVLPLNDLSIRINQAPNYCITDNQYTFYKRYYANLHVNDDGLLDGNIELYGVNTTRLQIGDNTAGERGNIYDGQTHNLTGLNATAKPNINGVTPTGDQGTKDQPLATLFPDWYGNAFETIGSDGKTKIKWLPVSLPDSNPLVTGNPFTTDQAQEGTMPQTDTDTMTDLGENSQEKTKDAPSYPTPPIAPVPDVTPTPTDPAIGGAGSSATGLANLYNPTLAQVKEFSRWLWGSDGLNLDHLKKLLQDPMQAIIGLHVMYATPTTGTERGIQVGYINSGVNSKIVTEQYTEIDCGTVTINEYFGDARDYSPFTQVYCYLPFIGIVELNADDVVNSTLGIKYKIDVLTGCCLAQLTVKKYGLDAVLYTYTGNCAVQMPITSGNYLSTVSSLLGAVVSGAAAVATGGALAPVAIGAAANALGGGARASVAMSGSLGSNAGAMGIRKPYLIIKRVEQADANGYNEFYGYPTNRRVNLSQLSGYVRVKDINLSGTSATEEEQNEIVALLREGVIL